MKPRPEYDIQYIFKTTFVFIYAVKDGRLCLIAVGIGKGTLYGLMIKKLINYYCVMNFILTG